MEVKPFVKSMSPVRADSLYWNAILSAKPIAPPMKATGRSDFLRKGNTLLKRFERSSKAKTISKPTTMDQVTLKFPELNGVDSETKILMGKIDIIVVSFPFDIFEYF